MRRIRFAILSASLLACVACTLAEDTPVAPAPAAAPKVVLKNGARVAVVGDSITEQKQYSKFIELYLTACLPQLECHVIQLGWGGEKAPGFQGRLNNDLLWFKPDYVTTCYGMNDGGYGPFSDKVGNPYYFSMLDIVKRLKDAGATVIVGSPGAVDTKCYKGGGETAKVYNATLAQLRDLAKKCAETTQMPFADVHTPLVAAMEKAKAALGEDYDVCGRDGVHPGPNGHLVMAYAFLKAMGIDGDIGTITVDLKGQSTASAGHKIVSAEAGKLEIESSRLAFCFSGDEKSPGGTRSILPFVPFNQELNRFVLIVKNFDGEKATVTWGKTAKTFTKAELEKGLNLTESFFDNPFGDQFRKLEGLIAAKQSFETTMIKSAMNQFPNLLKSLDKDKDAEAAVETLRTKLAEKYEKMHAAVRAAVAPVKHALTIEAAK